jgi:hypothetical protein
MGSVFFQLCQALGSGFDGGVHIFLGGLGAGGKTLSIGGAEGVIGRAVRGVFPLAVNEEGIFVLQVWLFHDASFG